MFKLQGSKPAHLKVQTSMFKLQSQSPYILLACAPNAYFAFIKHGKAEKTTMKSLINQKKQLNL